jgi:hypothetical protein
LPLVARRALSSRLAKRVISVLMNASSWVEIADFRPANMHCSFSALLVARGFCHTAQIERDIYINSDNLTSIQLHGAKDGPSPIATAVDEIVDGDHGNANVRRWQKVSTRRSVLR